LPKEPRGASSPGERLEEAIAVVRELNAKNILATLDHLGENTTNEREAIAAADEYLKILDAVAQTGGAV
jgi:proline dehydrogenase